MQINTPGANRGWVKLRRAFQNPADTIRAARGRIKGVLFTWWCRMFRPRIQIGRNLVLGGKLKIRGPGRVVIGDGVNIGMLVTPYTYAPDAVIRIGDEVFLNGTRLGCKERIDIGARCILAECRILDYDFHSVNPQHRNDPEFIKGSPITIGENVWITAQCFVQKGVKIGRNCTITPNSVVRSEIPAETVAGGNPAVVWKTLTKADAPAQGTGFGSGR